MFISTNWIREFCPFESDERPQEMGARFSLHAAEVEDVLPRGSALEGIMTARVEAVVPHPNADQLRLATIDVNGKEPLQVVCGAPNVRVGLMVPYARAGLTLGGRKIKKTKVRGVESPGMLCSQKELEISEDASGLWELPDDVESGAPLLQLFPDLVDTVLEVDNKSLTHRPDLWGHYGIAREFAAIYRTPLKPLPVKEELAKSGGNSTIRVSPFAPDVGGQAGLCRRYCGLQIDGVRVEPSPAWLQHRLLAIGSRPINNIVDITNYILFELGQPLHAFDTRQVGGNMIEVRRARSGESLLLLDDTTVELHEESLVIADRDGPVALAGVMGGAGSEISDSTQSIFLESANFSPVNIRRTSVRFGKRTDSSLRFEKAIAPENARLGILRAAQIVLDLCPGARVTGDLQDVGFEEPEPIVIRTTGEFLSRRLGAEILSPESRAILERLGFNVAGEDEGEWSVTVPFWRATKDISIREDLVEEVGRIHGYDNIAPTAPEWPVKAATGNAHRVFERIAKHFLTTYGGLSEVFTYSMVGAAHCRLFGMDPDAHLKIQNPLSEDMDRMRREVVPVLLEKARENQRFSHSFGIFELGRVYRKESDRLQDPALPDERSRLAAVLSYEAKSPENFYHARDLVLSLLDRLRVAEVVPEAYGDADVVLPWCHPAIAARVCVQGKERGYLARIHPAIEQSLELKGDVIAFDIDFDAIFESPRSEVLYRPPSRYPTVGFDVAVVCAARTPVRSIQDVLEAASGSHLRTVEVFDVFALEDDLKSVAFHLVFGSEGGTLGSDEVASIQDRVVQAVTGAGYRLR